MRLDYVREIAGATIVIAAAVLALQTRGDAAAVRAKPHWTIRDLGLLPGARGDDAQSMPNAIDEAGDVVGRSDAASGSHAFLWRRGRLMDLGTLGGANSDADAIEGTRIAGWAETKTGARHAVLWVNGVIHDLGTDGLEQSEATGFDRRGEVVGLAFSVNAVGDRDPLRFLAWHDGHPVPDDRDWGGYPGGANPRAGDCTSRGSNDDGLTVGECHGAGAAWRDGHVRPFGGQGAGPWDVNDRNLIVGDVSNGAERPTVAVVWQHGRMTKLPMLPGALHVQDVGDLTVLYQAMFVNERGEIAGIGTTRGKIHAVVWRYRRS